MADESRVDRALLVGSRDGDTEAFRELFERKHRRVYLIAYQILGDASRAEDVVQEVFLRLWEHCADYNPSFSVDAWLTRIASNRAIDHWRSLTAERKRRVEPAADVDPDTNLEGVAAASEEGRRGASRAAWAGPEAAAGWAELQVIWDELAADLPAQQRAAFVLRHIEERPTAEVAEGPGLQPVDGTVARGGGACLAAARFGVPLPGARQRSLRRTAESAPLQQKTSGRRRALVRIGL